jgi:putative cardiolipin synthase
LQHNTEIGVILDVPEIAKILRHWFDANIARIAFGVELRRDPLGYEQLRWHGWEQGREVIYSDEPQASFWRRCGVCAMSVLPIESRL